MKKSISAIAAAVLAASCLTSTAAMAEGADSTVSAVGFSMEMRNPENVEIKNDGTVVIPKEKLTADLTYTVDIYFRDLSNGAWSVSPKWNTSSEHLKVTKVNNPLDQENLWKYAYAETDENGQLAVKRNTYDLSVNSIYGSTNFTVRTSDGKALVPAGQKTDDFPLISFELTIDANTPEGAYEVFFATEEDNSTRCAMDAANGNTIYKFPSMPPAIKNLKIQIGSGASYDIGNINLDQSVDSSDASDALAHFAKVQTGAETTLNEIQKKNADVNFDGSIDSKDASDILAYYAYASTATETPKSFLDFYGRTIPENY